MLFYNNTYLHPYRHTNIVAEGWTKDDLHLSQGQIRQGKKYLKELRAGKFTTIFLRHQKEGHDLAIQMDRCLIKVPLGIVNVVLINFGQLRFGV